MTLGSAMAALLSADNDKDRKKASKDLVKAQDDLVEDAAKDGVVVTFGSRGIKGNEESECE